MELLNSTLLQEWYAENYERNLHGRRIIFKDIEQLLKNLPEIFKKEIIGHSENGTPIYMISIGRGTTKVLSWSQMHGNESTGTKALFDLFNLFSFKGNENLERVKEQILNKCALKFIVLLNPDGAIKFTRENQNNIDLNRDAVNIDAIESKLLRSVLDSFNPKFCFNLHDQRSIFNVEGTKNPATLSFLAPSEDVERTLTKGRIETMSVIVAMNDLLQSIIPNQIGRYTDEFYPTATGDNFQKLGHNTILIEAGHFKDDYDRESTRKFNFFALVQGLHYISTTSEFNNYKPYFKIPNNDKRYLDIIYKNVRDNENNIKDYGFQLIFKMKDGKLVSNKQLECVGDLSDYGCNKLINDENLKYSDLKLSNS